MDGPTFGPLNNSHPHILARAPTGSPHTKVQNHARLDMLPATPEILTASDALYFCIFLIMEVVEKPSTNWSD